MALRSGPNTNFTLQNQPSCTPLPTEQPPQQNLPYKINDMLSYNIRTFRTLHALPRKKQAKEVYRRSIEVDPRHRA